MDLSEIEIRIGVLRHAMEAMRGAWPFMLPVIHETRDKYIQSLIAAESAEVRGRIKGLQEVLDLPETLLSELRQLEQALDLPGNGG